VVRAGFDEDRVARREIATVAVLDECAG